MGMMQEFKEFAVKGNVMDLAVGVIIGGAFGKIDQGFNGFGAFSLGLGEGADAGLPDLLC